MNVLDENVIHSQRDKLTRWRIPFRQVGAELAHSGAQDPEIIPLLLRLKRPTFFTRDFDYFQPGLRHPDYCLAWLNVRPDKAAFYIRRFLRHRDFRTHAQRLGKVVRIHTDGLEYWQHGSTGLRSTDWLR
jgi:hypothetical protein